jgi:hypothetical protein
MSNPNLPQLANAVPTSPSFQSPEGFQFAVKMADFLAKSTLVPPQYQGNPSNCLIAIDLAFRMGTPPIMLMQQITILHQKPTLSAQLVIALLNNSGRFSALRWRMKGEGDNAECICYATELATGEVLESTPITIQMAKREGWWTRKDKNGHETSKWQTMPQQMMRYRSATFFARVYAPDILMGFSTDDELVDARIVSDVDNSRGQSAAPGATVSGEGAIVSAFATYGISSLQLKVWAQTDDLESKKAELREVLKTLKATPEAERADYISATFGSSNPKTDDVVDAEFMSTDNDDL